MKASELIIWMENLFEKVNKEYFDNELTMPKIIVDSHRKNLLGHFHAGQWTENGKNYHEISLNPVYFKNSTVEIAEVMIHECVHLYCHANHIVDTDKTGRRHNKNFMKECLKRGLDVSKDNSHGYGITSPTEETKEFCNREKIEKPNLKKVPYADVKHANPLRKYQCPSCGNSVRATKDLSVICGSCNFQMEKVNPDESQDIEKNQH